MTPPGSAQGRQMDRISSRRPQRSPFSAVFPPLFNPNKRDLRVLVSTFVSYRLGGPFGGPWGGRPWEWRQEPCILVTPPGPVQGRQSVGFPPAAPKDLIFRRCSIQTRETFVCSSLSLFPGGRPRGWRRGRRQRLGLGLARRESVNATPPRWQRPPDLEDRAYRACRAYREYRAYRAYGNEWAWPAVT